MKSNAVLERLNGELALYPERTSGEELYEFVARISDRIIKDDHHQFVEAMREWLVLRSEPKTMIAVDMIGRYHLDELRGELESLLEEIELGKAFKPFYARPIKGALDKIS